MRQARGGKREAPASRVSQACLRCSAKKIRCDGTKPACSTCTKIDLSCEYAATKKTRGPGRSKKLIQELQQRLSNVESQLHRPGAKSTGSDAPGDSVGTADTTAQLTHSSPVTGHGSVTQSPVSQPRASLHLNDATPFGEAFGDDMPPVSRAGMILDRATLEWRTIELQMSQEKFRSQAYTAMFSTDILKWLIDPRMEDRGTTDLAIHWSSLREQLAVPVTGIEGPGWMAKLDAAVAISIILRIENADLRERSDFAYGFLKNAFQIFPQLVIERDNIFALEALVAIAGFFVFSADKRTLAMLIAAAARMCHLSRLTLKRSGKKATMTVRKARVLLATYIIDQEASLNHGLPPSMEENEDDLDQLRQAGLEEILLIRYHLARVQSQINHRIYGSQVALENSQSRSMQELIVLLETCRMQIQDRETQLAGSSTPGLEGITNRILFYNCVNMVYWADDRRDTKQDTSLLWLTCPAPSASRRRCSKAARETLQIYTALSHVQFFIPYLLSAYFTLAAIILERPECPDAIVDAGIINSFAQFLDYMIQKNGLDLHQMLAGCTRFAEVIRYVAANGAANGQDPAAGPASTFSSHTPNELDIKAQALTMILSKCTHPMYLAQSLVGNLETPDHEEAKILADVMGVPFDPLSAWGPFAPEALRPDLHGFSYGDPGQLQ